MAVLIFVPLGLLMKLDAQTIAACCLVHFTYSYLLLAGNLVCERVFGESEHEGADPCVLLPR